ncbi:hypothetical protein HHK36_015751 [Tetracentron sinense]|uniref:HAUS augmin-like complex subunit 6 N-terminal domain-containing protein n=1 Tax=Tetracentron sinense TaxID=13715 RepID=A0A834Z6Q9_TETSI|nr:hypothetical protein HHK36_015751 [Tetracentron sinense]
MTMERDKEREVELESAMYTNCLLLGLDPAIIGVGGNNGTPGVGFFRHSNPKLGEQLLYFILSSLRGPIQSAKDFDKVWPIFDSAQSRDFRKVVQGIVNELESQGALPRSNSRVSSLATCCGPRFIELLWQLSLHALREVHRRTFAADVASNPLPASLTDVAFSQAATLLPVTKARIALERRKFLKNADTAVHRQAMWSNLAHEMTAEFRGLCAEEVELYSFQAYLQQELEKLQDLRNEVKLEGDLWDDRVSSSLGQKSHLVSKATRLWESLLTRRNQSPEEGSLMVKEPEFLTCKRLHESIPNRYKKKLQIPTSGQHEVLASGPIEDLIAHREHRYRISGSSLLAAMDQSSQVSYSDILSVQPGDLALAHADDREPMNGSFANVNMEKLNSSLDSTHLQVNDETISWVDDRSGRIHPTVDIAEILRRWTHALQRIHKQLLHLVYARANNGEGPELLQSGHDGGTSGHAESLAATLTEHRQHLSSIQLFLELVSWYIHHVEDAFLTKTKTSAVQVLINQLKEVAPAIQKSISELTEEVNSISSNCPPMSKYCGRSASPIQAQSSGRTLESSTDEVTSKLLTVQLEKVSSSPPALKLPHLFNLTPNSSGKGGNMQKRHILAPQTNQVENLLERKSLDQPLSNNHANNPPRDSDIYYVQNLRRSVREAALSVQSCDIETSRENHSDDCSEHFFVPLSATGFSCVGPETKAVSTRSKRFFASTPHTSLLEKDPSDGLLGSNYELSNLLNGRNSLHDSVSQVNGFLPVIASDFAPSDARKFYDLEEAQAQVYPPPLLMDTSLLADSYEDLLDACMFEMQSLGGLQKIHLTPEVTPVVYLSLSEAGSLGMHDYGEELKRNLIGDAQMQQ